MTREERIKKRLQEHYNYLQEKGYEVVCLCLQGSQNYKLDEYSEEYMSDIDTKAIVLPSFEDFCYGRSPLSTTIVLDNNFLLSLTSLHFLIPYIGKPNIHNKEK